MMTACSVGAVVLAAGASVRFGSSKQLARLDGETLLERAVRVAREAGCRPVVVVLGAAAEMVRAQCELGDAVTVVNDDWASGMGGSIRTGVQCLRGVDELVDGCIVMTCDMPAVTAAHLRRLMTGKVTASAYAGGRGVPAYFPAAMFAELMMLRGDTGARKLLGDARTVELAGGELDVDTSEDMARAEMWRR